MRFLAGGSIIRILGSLVLLCLCGVFAAAQSSVTDLRGNAADPFAGADRKPVVLVFLRTDCPVSQRYSPAIQQLASKYATTARFWLVFPSKDDNAENIAKYEREFGYRLSALRDPNHILVTRAKATITPEAAVFDSHGELRYHGRINNLYVSFGRSRRVATTHDLEDALTAVVAGKSVANVSAPAVGCYIADVK